MVVHLYGRVCWDECLKDVAARYGLKIVEDNAQAFGAVSAGGGIAGLVSHRSFGQCRRIEFLSDQKFGRHWAMRGQ